jgi:hypothetical protein
MATAWKSCNQKSTNDVTNQNTISGTMLSSWSRQQKLAMIASATLLALLLAISACSMLSSKPALTISRPVPTFATPQETPATTAALLAPEKKTSKKRPANVTYKDPGSGLTFLYPRKFALTAGYRPQPEYTGMGDAPMNFVQPGGITVAAVALPGDSYPGTDFESAFFNVNVNRSVSEQDCARFASVDAREADGESSEATKDTAKVKVGSTDMDMTSNFSANVIKQAETQYYHSYENGACYEYVLGLGTEGFATEGGVRHVNRDQVFAKLEKILATVKVAPEEPERAVEPAIAPAVAPAVEAATSVHASGKE